MFLIVHSSDVMKVIRLPDKVCGKKQLTLLGFSRAAEATGFYIPELGWQLDAGRVVSVQRPEHVFVTHTHSDHVQMLTHFVTRHAHIPEFYVPSSTTELVARYLLASLEMSSNCVDPPGGWEKDHELTGVNVGDEFKIHKGGDTYVVTVIKCDHTVPSVGYMFEEERKHLKKEFQGLRGREIAELHKSGREVDEYVRTPMFVFMGDTTAAVFNDHPEVLKFPLIITECTFLDDDHRGDAERTHHTCWTTLRPIVEANPETTFVLTHFSLRYKREEIRGFFEVQDVQNVIVWIEEGEPFDHSTVSRRGSATPDPEEM